MKKNSAIKYRSRNGRFMQEINELNTKETEIIVSIAIALIG